MMNNWVRLIALSLMVCLASVLLALCGVSQKSEALPSVTATSPMIKPNFSRDVENLSPGRREALNSPPSLVKKGAGGLGLDWVFPHRVESQMMTLAQADSDTEAVPTQPLATPAQNFATSSLSYDARLIDIRKVNSKIALDIRYATENNFLKRKVYPVSRCVLRGTAARRLAQVQQDLEKKGFGLKVYDCYRPLSVQKLMWQIKPDPNFVANPAKGSRHNRGAAVDLTMVDRNGKEVEMPTGFDDFTVRAHRNYSGASAQAKRNSKLLEDAMKKYGFIPLPTEWWHFDAPDWNKYAVLDVKFGEIPQ